MYGVVINGIKIANSCYEIVYNILFIVFPKIIFLYNDLIRDRTSDILVSLLNSDSIKCLALFEISVRMSLLLYILLIVEI